MRIECSVLALCQRWIKLGATQHHGVVAWQKAVMAQGTSTYVGLIPTRNDTFNIFIFAISFSGNEAKGAR